MMYQSEIYICSSLRLRIVMKTLIENSTQIIATTIASGHSSSAYSLVRLKPIARVTAAEAMPILKSQSVTLANPGLQSGDLVSRCVM